MINQSATQKLRDSDKFKAFFQWGKENGVLMNEVDMPCAFGELGIPGVAAKQDIPSNKVIIAVPYNLIITQHRARQGELNQILRSNPELFDEEQTQDAEFNILALYIFMERKKGEKSFYKSYFDVVQSGNTMFEWSKKDLALIDNRALVEEFLKLQVEMEDLWEDTLKIILKHPEVFGKAEADDRALFYWSYELVMTRCFGWSLKSTSIVPFADMLNHSNTATTHYVIHSMIERGEVFELEKKQRAAEEQYYIKRDKLDLELFGIEQENREKLHKESDSKMQLIRKNKVFLEDDLKEEIEKKTKDQYTTQEKRILINKINYNALKIAKDMQIWDIGFATSSDSEDNDTDEELVELRDKQFEAIRAKENVSFQAYIKQVEEKKNKLDGNNETSLSQVSNSSETPETSNQGSVVTQNQAVQSRLLNDLLQESMDMIYKDEYKEYTDPQIKTVTQTIQPNDSDTIAVLNLNQQKPVTIVGIPKEYIQHALVKQYLAQNPIDYAEGVSEVNLLQTKQEEKEKYKEIKELKQQAEGVDADEEEDGSDKSETEWDWLSDTDQQAYFCIVTTNFQKKGEEIHVSYGRRTNRFLLVWYGFVIENNKYSSYNFRLWMSIDHKGSIMDDQLYKRIVLHKVIGKEEYDRKEIEYEGHLIPIHSITNEFRVRKHKICMGKCFYGIQELILYLRLFLMVYYKGEETMKLLISIPVSIEYEIFVLQFMVGLISYLIKEHPTTIEEDKETLKNPNLTMQQRFATWLNLEGKEILMNQMVIVLDGIILLKRMRDCDDMKQVYLDFEGRDQHKSMESIRPLKEYLKELHKGIFKHNLHKDLKYIL